MLQSGTHDDLKVPSVQTCVTAILGLEVNRNHKTITSGAARSAPEKWCLMRNLEVSMELEVKNILPQRSSDKNVRSAFCETTATARAREPRIRFNDPSNRFEGNSVRLPLYRRGKLLTLALLLLAAAGAHAQAVFSTPQSPQNVGSATSAQSVTVTAVATGTVAKVEVLTGGASGLDFSKGSGSSTCESASVTAGGTCTESVTFTPAYPGLRLGAVELLDGSNHVLGINYLSGVGAGGLDVLSPGNLLTVAGELHTYSPFNDGVLATTAHLDQPSGVALDGNENVYIADKLHNAVRMVCSSNSASFAGTPCAHAGYIITIAGNGTLEGGYTGDTGLATAATLNEPSGIAVDGAGNVYIADTTNNVIRKIVAATGIIATVAGDHTAGYAGETQLATAAELNGPMGVTLDAQGNLYIADTENHRIRRVDAVTGIITTAAGNGVGTYSGDGGLATSASIYLPYAVAFDLFGNMYIPDSGNHRVRLVLASDGLISTVAGTGNPGNGTCTNGNPTSEDLKNPSGVALDAASNLYIADTADECIRKTNSTATTMTTIAQSNLSSLVAGNLVSTAVYAPIGIAVDGRGNVFYADSLDMVVDVIQSNLALLDYLPTPVLEGEQSAAPLPQIVENDGYGGAQVTSVTANSADNSALDVATTTCVAPPVMGLTQDEDCTINAFFAPSAIGNPLFGNVYVSGNTVNDENLPLDIVLVGDGAAFTISLTSAPNPSAFGTSVAFTATVKAGSGTATGNVTFTDSLNGGTATTLGTVSLTGGQAIYNTSALAVGVHTITATYGTDNSPATVPQTVYEKTSTTLTAAPASPSTLGTNVVFTANVSALNGAGAPVAGTVTFTDSVATFTGNAVPVTVNGATGTASFTATNLAQGPNVITATFTPSTPTTVYPSTGTLTQDVQAGSAVALTSAPATSAYGTPVVFSVAVPMVGSTAATGSISIKIVPVGSSTAAATLNVTLAGNPAAGSATTSTLAVGSYNVTATYAGDSNYSAGTATLGYLQVVTQVQTSTRLTATPSPGNAGNTVVIATTVTPSSGSITPTGSVTLTDTLNGYTITLGGGAHALSNGAYSYSTATLAPGAHTLTATYSGNTDDATSSATISLTINRPTTTTTVTAAPAAPIAGKPVAITAVVAPSAGAASPAGSITFTDTFNGSTITLGGSAQTLAHGAATVNLSTLAPGTHSIAATYAGDTDDAGSSGTLNLPVVQATTATTVAATPNPAVVNGTVTFTSAVTGNGAEPTGTVNFLANGTTNVGSGTLSGSGDVTVTNATLAAGTYQITAVYSGDANDKGSTSAAFTLTIGTIPTATDLSTAATTGANAQSILVATVNDKGMSGTTPTGTVTFTSAGNTIGSAALNANGVATLTPVLGTGSYNVVASYPGDAQHGSSSSMAMPVTGAGSSFAVGVNPDSVTLAVSQNATITVSLTSISGFSDTINLGCVGLPKAVTCHFSTISLPLSANGAATAQLTIDTDNPLGGGTTAMNQKPGSRNPQMAALWLPFSLFMGWILWSFRRRHGRILSMIVVLVLTGAALLATGCGGGFSQSTAAPGTYVMQVTGVGTHSNVTQYQTFTLNITQ